jgi:hypothetical protein
MLSGSFSHILFSLVLADLSLASRPMSMHHSHLWQTEPLISCLPLFFPRRQTPNRDHASAHQPPHSTELRPNSRNITNIISAVAVIH